MYSYNLCYNNSNNIERSDSMKFQDFTYERPNLEEAKAAIFEQIDLIKKDENVDAVKAAVEAIQKVKRDINTNQELAMIRNSIDTNDEFYEKEMEFWNEQGPVINEWITEYYRATLDSQFLKDIEDIFPQTLVKMAQNSLKTFSPEIIPLLQQENKLTTKYSKLVASAEIPYKDKVYNIPGLGYFAQSEDRQERKIVHELIGKFFSEHQDEFDQIYDDMVKVRHEMATKLGFKDFVEMGYARMNRLDYSRQDVEVYRKEVLEHIVPISQDYFNRQQERLGLDEMKYYDLTIEFPDGNPDPVGTPDDIVDAAVKMYHEMSPETGEFIDFMVEGDLLDLVTKPGKQQGGYCTYIPNFKAPFIFSNFNGTRGDVDVLTHEAGHAFQVFNSRWIMSPEIVYPTYESCEIHSMSMEFFAWPWMENFFQDQTEKYKYSHLGGCVTFLPYGVLVDHYQHEVYEHPEMTPEERRQTWRKLEQQYLPWKDYDGNEFFENGGFWFKQLHIFNMPFYYIDYTLAQMCALQFWQRNHVQEDPTAWEDYMNLCKVGGTKSFLELVELGHLRSPFEPGSLKSVADDANAYLLAHSK